MDNETNEEAEKRVAKALDELLVREGMVLELFIVKVAMQVQPGVFIWGDQAKCEIKKKKVQLAMPNGDPALKKVAFDLLNGGKK